MFTKEPYWQSIKDIIDVKGLTQSLKLKWERIDSVHYLISVAHMQSTTFSNRVWTFTAGRPPYARAGYLTGNFRKLWPRSAFNSLWFTPTVIVWKSQHCGASTHHPESHTTSWLHHSPTSISYSNFITCPRNLQGFTDLHCLLLPPVFRLAVHALGRGCSTTRVSVRRLLPSQQVCIQLLHQCINSSLRRPY